MPAFINNIRSQINNFWNKFDKKQKIQIGIISLLLISSIALLVYIINRPNYEVLYSDLSVKDAGAVVDKLKNELKIPYKIEGNGSTILVPAQYKDEARMQLATEGIPQDGFSFSDAMNNSLATTDQERKEKYIYFVQNEIQNTLKTIDGVQDAKVNIVVPDENNFVLSNNDNSSTAAVMLQLKPGVTLTNQQINGITNFVSKSVEGLSPDKVTIIDGNGKVLVAQNDNSLDGASSQYALQMKVQNDLQNNIQSLLEQVFGPGNVIVRASVNLNFDKQVQDKVEWQPVIDNNGIIRSTQTIKEIANGSSNGGTSGTSSNNPGGPSYPTPNGGNSNYSKTDTTINYEINQIKTTLTSAQGKIQNISLSVVVNNNNLSPTMKQQLTDLVSNAAGGKNVSVSVMGIKFNTDLLNQMKNTQKQTFPYVWLIILGALLLAGGVFYAMKKKNKELIPATNLEEAMSTEEPGKEIEELDVTSEKDEKMKQIEKFIKQKPDIVAQLIRTWLNEE
ncbi:flagellar basal-body MS-ring/collar protein FliF [Thermoanaerobacterium thermosaccharolyticum]|uniref:flagellar basal-body MS-ring/collar protein FliF n=1 Tax=Thermoanaerobacterium thermosaccharolyticum TaxID=1517 RepID=UPI003D28ADCF